MQSRFWQKDVLAGLICVAVAIYGVIQASAYTRGTASQMGPGYLPLIVFALLGIVGAGLVAWRLGHVGEALEPWAWRPLAAIFASIVVFGAVVDRLGFVLSAILMIVIATRSNSRLSLLQLVILSVATAILSGLLFVSVLKLPIPLWPEGIPGWN